MDKDVVHMYNGALSHENEGNSVICNNLDKPRGHCCCLWSLSCVRYFWPHDLQSARLLGPWDSPGKNTGVGCHFLLQGIFPTQGLNPSLRHCRWILYHWVKQLARQILYNLTYLGTLKKKKKKWTHKNRVRVMLTRDWGARRGEMGRCWSMGRSLQL